MICFLVDFTLPQFCCQWTAKLVITLHRFVFFGVCFSALATMSDLLQLKDHPIDRDEGATNQTTTEDIKGPVEFVPAVHLTDNICGTLTICIGSWKHMDLKTVGATQLPHLGSDLGRKNHSERTAGVRHLKREGPFVEIGETSWHKRRQHTGLPRAKKHATHWFATIETKQDFPELCRLVTFHTSWPHVFGF